MRARRFVLSSALSALALAACVGDEPSTSSPPNDGGSVTDGSASAPDAGGHDAATPPMDATGLPDAPLTLDAPTVPDSATPVDAPPPVDAQSTDAPSSPDAATCTDASDTSADPANCGTQG